MKRILTPLASALFAVSTFAQGQINFATKVGSDVDAPVFNFATGTGPGPEFSAQLFLAQAGSLVPLIPATTFRSGSPNPVAAKYVVNVDPVVVPVIPSGSPATVVMRVWRTSLGSYEQAIFAGGDYGQSQPLTITLGGGLLPDANLSGLQGFSIGVFPEPSSIAIGLLGASALLLARRSKTTGARSNKR